MNSAVFNRCAHLIIQLEGGDILTQDPDDPGGATKYGISKRAFPKEDIPSMTLERAMGLYKECYWDTIRGDRLPPSLALCVFDCAVNQGQGTAVRLLQCAVKAKEDGVMGDKTIHMVEMVEQRELISDYMARRAHRYVLTEGYSRYGRGWLKRLFRISHEAQTIVPTGES